MNKPFIVIFGSLIAFMLLLLYASVAGYMIYRVMIFEPSDDQKVLMLHDGLVFVVTTVGGLVSALVISKLAITKPGENPEIILMAETLDEHGNRKANRPATFIVVLYLLVWGLTGLTALVVGVIVYHNINSTVSDIGTTWLGLAVAAGYSYFGISPQNNQSMRKHILTHQ